MEKKYYEEMVDNSIKQETIFRRKDLFIFGHCEASLTLADFLLDRGFVPKGILDNSSEKQGLNYKGIDVIPPASILANNKEDTVVLIVTRFYEAMNSQLRQMGYIGKVIKLVDYNTYAEYSLSEDTIARKTKRLQDGQRKLAEIKQENPDSFIVFCPFNALGDVYFAMSYLKTFANGRGYENIIACVPSSVCGQVVRLFGYARELVLPQKELDAVIQAVIYNRDEQCYIAHQDRPYVVNLHLALKIKLIPLETIYKCGVFGLPIDTAPVIPTNWEEYADIDQIDEGRTVIISPYSKSIPSLPNELWDEIVQDYLSQGYIAYTNVAGDEKPLPNTKPITVKLCEMKSLVEKAGTFIGIRSGLCDVIRTANCKKIALYSDYNYSDTKWKAIDMYSIEGFENIVVDGDFKWKN